MAKTNSLVLRLRTDFPAINLEESDDFYWSPTTKTVYFDSSRLSTSQPALLHELAHALLDHRHFDRDIDLLRIERQAWDYAKDTLAPRYDLAINTEFVEDMIDTYRQWLHARSTCPTCSLTGIQIHDATYHCLGCRQEWRVNDARRCGLRRYSLNTQKNTAQ